LNADSARTKSAYCTSRAEKLPYTSSCSAWLAS
jgi:hypothetical protein